MPERVKLIECPRDAWQGLRGHIPAALKAEYLRALIAAGCKHIDAVSFVSPKTVPQMADSEEVLKLLGDVPDDLELIGIVVNEAGMKRALAAERVRTVGYVYSVSPTFLERNQKQTPEQSLDTLEKIKEQADNNGLNVVVYISMAFGNPYGDVWSADEVAAAVDLLEKTDIHSVSLADTVGLATPAEIAALVGSIVRQYDHLDIGVHLHARPADAVAKVLAAFDAGARRFDSALGGLGGCPFAQDELVGNIPTEAVFAALQQRNAARPQLRDLDSLIRRSAQIGAQFSGAPTHIQ